MVVVVAVAGAIIIDFLARVARCYDRWDVLDVPISLRRRIIIKSFKWSHSTPDQRYKSCCEEQELCGESISFSENRSKGRG